MAKKKSQSQITEAIRKRCVKIAKDICKELAGYKCAYCERTKAQGWQMHGSHIYPEGIYKAMSADPDNILCLCATHHNGGPWKGKTEKSWHEDPIYFADWFRENYPELYILLKKRSQDIQHGMGEYEWTLKLQELKKQYKELCSIKSSS